MLPALRNMVWAAKAAREEYSLKHEDVGGGVPTGTAPAAAGQGQAEHPPSGVDAAAAVDGGEGTKATSAGGRVACGGGCCH